MAFSLSFVLCVNLVMLSFSTLSKASPGQDARHRRSGPVDRFDVNLKGTNSYEDIKGSDVVIVTAGLAAQAGHEP